MAVFYFYSKCLFLIFYLSCTLSIQISLDFESKKISHNDLRSTLDQPLEKEPLQMNIK